MSNPKLIFGCATVGYSFTNTAETSQLLDIVKSTGITTLDTAARYPPSSPGLSEKLLGSAGAVDKGFAVDTKINVFGNGEGCLAAPAIEESLNQSLTDLSEVIASCCLFEALLNLKYSCRSMFFTAMHQTTKLL